jgi:acetyltransferase-like isoleucine patch superfamily enzyme
VIKGIITFLRKLFWRFIRPEDILLAIDKSKINKCLKNTAIEKDTVFYPEAQVNNFAEDRQKIKIGTGTHIRGELTIYPYSKGIFIGDNSYIGNGSVIRSGEKIEIGNNVLIAHNVTIIDSDSHEIDYLERSESFRKLLKEGHPENRGNVITKAIKIDDYAWISFNVSILKGVTIGAGAIIGAGAVVTENIPPFTVAIGNPARVVKQLN